MAFDMRAYAEEQLRRGAKHKWSLKKRATAIKALHVFIVQIENKDPQRFGRSGSNAVAKYTVEQGLEDICHEVTAKDICKFDGIAVHPLPPTQKEK